MKSPDALLAAAIGAGNPALLESLVGILPRDFLTAIGRLLDNNGGSAEQLHGLAGLLAGGGLPVAALTAVERAAALSMGAPARGRMLLESAELHRHLGSNGAAAQRSGERLLGQPTPLLGLLAQHDGNLRVVSAILEPAAFAALRDTVADHPLNRDPIRSAGALTERQAKLDPVTGGAEDCSFIIADGDHPLLQVACGIEGDGPLSCFQAAIRLVRLAPAGDDVIALALRHLAHCRTWAQVPFILIETDCGQPNPEPLTTWIAAYGKVARRLDWAWVDLANDDATLLRDMRQTHRQQIRWGAAHLTIIRWHGPADGAILDEYAALCLLADRIAMPRKVLERMLGDAVAWLDIGYLDGIPACAQILTRHGDTDYYAAGVTTPGDKRPQSHAMIMHAMQQARMSGLRRFHFGVLHVDPAFSDKQRSIAMFKRGFTHSFQPVQWHAVHPPA